MAPKLKEQIITFKVDGSLAEAMDGIPNRSQFIRAAILAALDSICPLCKGTGILTPDQRKHWDAFSDSHTITKCDDCDAVYVVCKAGGRTSVHRRG